jgi:hypothetical protein
MVIWLKNVKLWQAIYYLMNLKIKLKYAVQLRRSTYLGGLNRRVEYMSADTVW